MSLYQRNMAVLRACSPTYADRVETAPPDPRLEIIPSPSGRPDLKITTGPNESFLLYDSDDPPRSVRTNLQSVDFKETKATIIFGLGLGYQAAALAEMAPSDHVLFVVEENPALVKLALHVVDLTRLLAFHRLVFVQPEGESLKELGRKMGWKTFSGRINILVEARGQKIFSPDFLARMERFIRRLKQKNRSRSAWTKAATEVVDNSISNLPLILLSPSVAALKDVLTGAPAIVVSAGPSLKTCAAELARAKDRAAIIATAPVLRVLLAHEVKPDLVGVLDYTPSNYDVLRDVYQNRDTPLVFLDQTCPALVRDYQGELIAVRQTQGPLQRWLGPHLNEHTHWSVGGNVGSFCLDLALYLGADPIILVGQDLSFPDLTSHSEGVVGRRIIGEPPDVSDRVWLESVSGGRVLSDLTLASYLEEFQRTVARTDRTIINTSPQGARIPGTVEMDLDQALDRYCRKKHDFQALIRPALNRPTHGLGKVLTEMAASIKELGALEIVATECLELNRRLADLMERTGGTRSPEFFNLNRMQAQYSHKAWEYCRNFEPLRVYLTPQSSRLIGEKRIEPSAKHQKDHSAALERNRVMMSAASQAARHLRHLITGAMKQLSEFSKADGALTGASMEAADHRLLARAWLDLGRWGRAWPHYCQAINWDPEAENLIREAAHAALAKEDLIQARGLARRLLNLKAGRSEAVNLLSRIERQEQIWLDQAREALSAGDWVTALLLARKVLAAEPDQVEAHEIQKRCFQIRTDRIKTEESAGGPVAVASLQAGKK